MKVNITKIETRAVKNNTRSDERKKVIDTTLGIFMSESYGIITCCLVNFLETG